MELNECAKLTPCTKIPPGKIRGYLQALLDAEGTVPDFVRVRPFETFSVPSMATVAAGAGACVSAAPRVLSAAAIEAGLLPGWAGAGAATTPEVDYHRPGQARDEADGEDDEDEIVLAPALAGLSLRPA